MIQPINITTIRVDTMASKAIGLIKADENFMLSQAFGYQGNLTLYSNKKDLYFEGAASLAYDCGMRSRQVNFKSYIDPKNVMIPIGERQFDVSNELVVSGSYLSVDSAYIYPTMLSARRSWSDVGLITSNGNLWFDNSKKNYVLASVNKIVDPSIPGNMIVYNTEDCTLTSEGSIDLGAKFDLINVAQAGTIKHVIDSSNVDIRAMLAFDFHFSQEALSMMTNEFRLIPTLQPVDMNNEFSTKAFADLIGEDNAKTIRADMGLNSSIKGNNSNFNYKIVLTDVNLYWDEANSSFRSKGKIGLGFIGKEVLNVYVDGYVEIQRRRSGDTFDIYLKADNSTWYYFSYVNGNMMTQSSNFSYNGLIADMKINQRRHPESTSRVTYVYMIASEDRLSRFLRRMEE
ncbi:MAG: hypothetical protein J6T30_02580 [Bacteroidales bacterium]|nr:hypothetical protein [Bacteroidales bacterium]